MELATAVIIPAFLLIFARVAGLVFFAPGWSESFVSFKIRVFLCIVLTFALGCVSLPAIQITLFSSVWTNPQVWTTVTSLPFVGVLLIEGMIGILQAVLLRLIFTTLEYVGTLLAQMGGLSLAEVFDPQQNRSTNILAHLLGLCGLAIYFAIGGDRLLVKTLMDDIYHTASPFGIPMLQTTLSQTTLSTTLSTGTESHTEALHVFGQNIMGIGDYFTHWIPPLLQIVTQSMLSGVLIALPILISLGTVYFLTSLLSRLVSAWSFWNTGLPVVVLSTLGLFTISLLWILSQFENLLSQIH